MARTAPAVNGTPTYKQVSLRWIDASGDPRADTLQLPAAATDVQIEAIADTLSDISNASLYSVHVSDVYNSTADKDDAVDAVKDSVYDNIAVLAKTATNETRRLFIPAPEGALFVAGTDTIDPANADLAAAFAAFLAPLGVSYNIVSARYTERREINEAVKI
jgi:hypothetical protein